MHPSVLYWFQLALSRGRALPGLTLPQTQAIERDLQQLSRRQVHASPALQKSIIALIEEHGLRDAHATARARAALHTSLVLLIRESRRIPAMYISETVSRAMRWIGEHVAERFRVAEAAQHVAISSVQLQSRFRSELGCSVGKYRARLRIERAQRLLVESDRAVTKIAYELGFASSQHFATAFRSRIGVSPERYRRSRPAPPALSRAVERAGLAPSSIL